MSEDQDRNSQGQFTSGEVLTGLRGIEAESGVYQPMAEAVSAPTESELTLEDAEQMLEAQEQPEQTTPIGYLDREGNPLNDDATQGKVETVSLEKAADDKTAYDATVLDYTLANHDAAFAKIVDEQRAEAIKGNEKELAQEFGIEVPKSPEVKADEAAIDAVEGLNDDTRKYLKNPQIRESIQKEFDAAEQVKAQHLTELEQARVTHIAAIAQIAPHLMQLPPADFERGLQVLSQVDPAAFQQVSNLLNSGAQIGQALAQAQAQNAQIQKQQFEAQRQQYSRASDEALGPMTYAEKAEMVDELASYVEKYGLTRAQLAREAETNLALHHPAFQRMAADAIRYNRIQNAAKAVPTRQVPQVQKPGTYRSRDEIATDDLRSMYKQLDGAKSESAQLRIAARIMGLK